MPRTFPTLEARIAAKTVRQDGGCWLWIGRRHRLGYGQTSSGGRNVYVHRAAWEIANGCDVPAGACVLHSCDVYNCVNPAHLRLGSQKDNAADRHARGRANTPRGSQHGMSRLTEDGVRAMRVMALDGRTTKQMMEYFRVSETTVQNVIWRRTWRHVRQVG